MAKENPQRPNVEFYEDVKNLRKPLAGHDPLNLHLMVQPGELYETLDDGKIHCYACGHHCKISSGGRGICQVRYNLNGTLYVPWGYVAALQCDPTEKKPFYHLYPGSDTLTFGMLGCDLHCSYCFTGDTPVVTNRGVVRFDELFDSAERVDLKPDVEIASIDGLQAVAESGQWQNVRAIFRHPYKGKLAVIKPYYLPEIKCTADHRIYVTDNPSRLPEPIKASDLTLDHHLVIPRTAAFSLTDVANLSHSGDFIYAEIIETEHYFLVPVQSIEFVEYDGDVFNMEVEVEHNYLAGFFLVKNCQNWDISQALRDTNAGRPPTQVSPQQMVQMAKLNGAKCVASSYNEPLITSEWAVSIFKEAKAAGFTCMYISNGNATREVLEYIRPYTDGYKIDLKTMNPKNYRQLGAVLDNVLDGIRMAHELGFWVEIVTLVIPGFNDSVEELKEAAQFIRSLSPDIPWHVTAFHKDYKMTEPDNTDTQTLIRAAEIGYEMGLNYVYAGNQPGRVEEYEHTFCPNCKKKLIDRIGYVIRDYQITPEGRCPRCNTKIAGLWPKDKAEVRLGSLEDLYFRRPRPVRWPR